MIGLFVTLVALGNYVGTTNAGKSCNGHTVTVSGAFAEYSAALIGWDFINYLKNVNKTYLLSVR